RRGRRASPTSSAPARRARRSTSARSRPTTGRASPRSSRPGRPPPARLRPRTPEVRLARRIALPLAAGLALLAALPHVAGEQVEVVVLRTFDADGGAHETKMWVVDRDGRAWVRVAQPGRLWYRRLLANPRVDLVRGGRTEARRASPDESPAARAATDAAF